MIKKACMALAFLLGCVGSIWADDIPFRQQRREMFSVLPTNEKTIVFVGNSITNFGTWPEVFANEDYRVVNRGISGNLTPEVMQHIRLIADGHPHAIYLMIGINDFGTPDVIVPGIRRMVQLITQVSPATDVYVQSILPCAYSPRETTPTTQNPLIRQMLQSDFGDNPRVHYADVFPALSANGSSPDNGTMDDRLHPNVNGYRRWTQALYDNHDIAIQPAYSQETWNDVSGLHYYQNRMLGQYAMLPITDQDILMLGDALVQSGEWAELMNNDHVKNRGIGIGIGNPAGCLSNSLERLQKELPSILHGDVRPAKIALQVGMCDILLQGATAQNTMAAYQQCLQDLQTRAPETELYIHTLIPVHSSDNATYRTRNAELVQFNQLLRQYAQDHPTEVTLVDIAAQVSDTDGFLLTEYQGANTLQSKIPNARLYLLWANMLSQAMHLTTTPRPTMTATQYQLVRTIDDTYGQAYALTVGNHPGNATQQGMQRVLDAAEAASAHVDSQDEATLQAQLIALSEATAQLSTDMVTTPQTQDAQGQPQYYTLRSQRNGRYVTAVDGNTAVQGTTDVQLGSYWRFVSRPGTQEYNLVNYATSTCISADGVGSGRALQLVSQSPAKGWQITISRTSGYLNLKGDGIQFNQSNGNDVLNWIDNTAAGDPGCNYTIQPVLASDLPTLPQSDLDTKTVRIATTGATTLSATDVAGRTQYYVLKNRGRGYYATLSGTSIVGSTASPDGTPAQGNAYLVSLQQLSTDAQGTTTARISYYANGQQLTFPAANNTALSTSAQGTTVTLAPSQQDATGWYISSAASGTTLYLNGNPTNPVTWNAAENTSTYFFYPVTFEDGQELTYRLTDPAGNTYTYSALGVAGQTLPTLTGATLGQGTWSGSTYTAAITFPFSVSRADGRGDHYVGISAFNGTQFYYYATEDGTGVRVHKGDTPDDYNYAWCIIPSMDQNGAFTFTLRNAQTGTYITTAGTSNSHEANAVSLTAQPTSFTFENNGFKLSTGRWLSVNTTTESGVQNVGTWTSHDGIRLHFEDLNLDPLSPAEPEDPTVTYRLTDPAGNTYIIRNSEAVAGETLPTLTGATLGQGTWQGNTYTAPVTFPFTVSRADGTGDHYVGISAFNGTQFYYYATADGTGVRVHLGNRPEDYSYAWCIIPSMDQNGAFTFTLRNAQTGTYITTAGASNSHDAGTVTLTAQPTSFTFENNGFKLPTGRWLSVNGSREANEQIVGTWTSHGGISLHFEDLNLEPLQPEEPIEGAINYALDLQHPTLLNLLPQPQSVRWTGSDVTLSGGIQVLSNSERPIPSAVDRFITEAHCTQGSGTELHINYVSAISGTENPPLEGFGNEAYAIKIDAGTITVSAIDTIGVVRAMQTLSQMAAESSTLPGCEIVDWSAFKIRGLMHDIGRSYISVAELKQEIDLLSRFKENVLLWHLTDKHGFRFESLTNPRVNTNFSPTRTSSSREREYYTQDECREVMNYARERGMIIIPEIDMPGHSARFQGATGYTMASEGGKAILKQVLTELVNTFEYSPYIHIGGDEDEAATREYVNDMANHVRSLRRKVVVWNCYGRPFKLVTPGNMSVDMVTNWGSAGTKVTGIPNIDMRYNYINHFDMYADLAGIYRSTIFGQTKGDRDVAGSITGIWNDRLISDENLIVRENNLYANALATAERGWKGGGRAYIDTPAGGAYLPNSGADYDEFKDWETRFLYHKGTTLLPAIDKIPYVQQTHIRWNITKAYNNGGNGAKTFEPETQTDLEPQSGSITATGAGIWLNHVWAGTVGSVLGRSDQPVNQTRYAWTYVHSDVDQEVSAQVETYNYSRSQMGSAPAAGQWDHRGSEIWVNEDKLVPNVTWNTVGSGEESELGNLNFTARPLMRFHLNKGWNRVMLKLPYTGQNPGAYPKKWQFTFVITDEQGHNALPGLIYSPSKCIDENAEDVAALIQEVRNYIDSYCNDRVGYYPASLATSTATLCTATYASLGEEMSAEDRQEQKTMLRASLDALRAAVAQAGTAQIIRPTSTTPEQAVYYTLQADRGSKYATSNGSGAGMTGVTTAAPQSMWCFQLRPEDGTYDLVNFADTTYLTPLTAYNKTLVSSTQRPENGWTLTPSATIGRFMLSTTAGGQNNELHQTNQNDIYNWGWQNGTSAPSDADGCRYLIEEITEDMLPRRVTLTYHVQGETTYAENNYRLGELNVSSGSTTVAIPSVKDDGATRTYLVNPGAPITVTQRMPYHGWNTPTIVRSQADTLHFDVTYTPNLDDPSQYLWYTTRDGHPYRIPAIARMSNDSLIAVMDYRTCNDDIGMGEVDLVARRGAPDGSQWTPEYVIADGDPSHNTYPFFGYGYGDAALVADRESPTVVVMCVSGKVRYTSANASTHPCVARLVSDDYGRTWRIEDLTSQFMGQSGMLPGSYALFFGSGRIVQSKKVRVNGHYRLYASIVSRGTNANGNYVVYSDDLGAHWTILGTDANYTSCAPNGNEPKVEELPNGDIMLSSRKGSGRYYNVFHFANFPADVTRGTWGPQTNSTGITAADCNGEILIVDAYRTYDGEPAKVLLQSVPCNNSTRRDVGIYYHAIDSTVTYTAQSIATGWTKGMAVSNLESAYSTMIQQQDGRIAFLYEEAPTFNNTFGYAEVYRPISIYEATGGAYQLEPVQHPTRYAYLRAFTSDEEFQRGHINWVGVRNHRERNYTAYVTSPTATQVDSHTGGDAQADGQLFAFIGTPERCYILNRLSGSTMVRALGYTSSDENSWVTPGQASPFAITESTTTPGTLWITPVDQPGQSWNMNGGAGKPIRFYRTSDGGSNWLFDLTRLYGDVNGDTQVDLEDITALRTVILQDLQQSTLYNLPAADTDGDGRRSVTDVTTLIRHLLEGEE